MTTTESDAGQLAKALVPIHGASFIDGTSVDAPSPDQVTSPATGEVIGSVAQATADDVDRAVGAGRRAAPAWAALTPADRAAAMRRVAEAVTRHRDELALLLSLEQGKPYFTEAFAEVDVLIKYFEEAGETARRLTGFMPASEDANKRVLVYRIARGVVGAIQPWNYPLETMGIQVAPALACGNSVVAVPAPSTSLVAHVFARCVEEAELPAGVFNLVIGPGAVVGDALAGHPGVNAIAFTGSTVTGGHVARRAAGKPQLLELGGNGPFVVLDDADLDVVVPAALTSCFYASGQACTAAERILVASGIYDEFAGRLADAVTQQIHLGHSLHRDTVMGPLHNENGAAKMDRHVEDAVEKGAVVLAGGNRADRFPTHLYWEPTVLADVTEDMLLSSEETFGPIAPLQRIADEAEALELMRRAEYGLATAVFTRDLARGLRFAERAPAGTVMINEASIYLETGFPFGGAPGSSSGIGRAHGAVAMEQVFTDLKTVVVDLGRRL